MPPAKFLPLLRKICDEVGSLLVLDEIYTGFGRTGRWFATEHSGTIPDIICLGKALTGGFPLSACVGHADLMDQAWPLSSGEAIHTSTYLGHPVGCAMALAQIAEVRSQSLCERAKALGEFLRSELEAIEFPKSMNRSVRGSGLLIGLELRQPDGKPDTGSSLAVIKRMLKLGFVLLPEGESSNVISFTPPLTVTKNQLHRTVLALEKSLGEL